MNTTTAAVGLPSRAPSSTPLDQLMDDVMDAASTHFWLSSVSSTGKETFPPSTVAATGEDLEVTLTSVVDNESKRFCK